MVKSNVIFVVSAQMKKKIQSLSKKERMITKLYRNVL